MPDCRLTESALAEWFATPQGHYVLDQERAYFNRTISDIFGFNALQLGLPEHDLLESSRMPLRLNLRCVKFLPAELPFASDGIDLLVMPHLLEFSETPHQILREAERVLMPEGSLLISGFNPLSVWGLNRIWANKKNYPWCGKFIALPRLKDWLALLGFEVVGGGFAAYAPPFRQQSWLNRCAFMEAAGDRWWAISGGIYFVHAVKRMPGMRLIKPRWNDGLVRKLLPVTPKLNNKDVRQSEQN
jgi:SAM-dependent methyltransferase